MREKEISAEDLEAIKARFDLVDNKLVYKDDHNKKVGWKDKGYLRVKVLGKLFYQHRVVWFLYTGKWPTIDIDHIDQDKSNNKPKNLRLATNTENCMNRLQQSGKKLPRGVYWSKERNKFRAILCVKGKNKHLGYYETSKDAREAYLNFAKNLYGDFVHDG